MIDFTFNNPTKVFFGEKVVENYLEKSLKQYGKKIMFCYGGGAIKRIGIYDEIMGILEPVDTISAT